MALVGALLIAGCGGETVTLPNEPPALRTVGRYGFGDRIHARDTRAMVAAMDVLEPVYGPLRTGTRELAAGTTPAALRAAFEAGMAGSGWIPAPELGRWTQRNSFAFGWTKEGKVYVIVGLDNDGTTATSPVTILTNIPGPTTAVQPPDAS